MYERHKDQRKVDGKSGGVSSFVKPKYTQGKTFGTFILCDIIVTIYNNQVVIDAIDAFNHSDNSYLKNVIHIILNVEVLTSKIGHGNPMHKVYTQFEPKDIGYNVNFFKYVSEDDNEDVN